MTFIYTDGGCRRATDIFFPSVGAWAFRVEYPDGTVIERSGAEVGTTNNKMELTALIQALSFLAPADKATVYLDSHYVLKGLTVFRHTWERNGWRTVASKPVANQGEWRTLIALYRGRELKLKHVKGHTGNVGNERVDLLCREAMARVCLSSIGIAIPA